jgi:hypothetical protein
MMANLLATWAGSIGDHQYGVWFLRQPEYQLLCCFTACQMDDKGVGFGHTHSVIQKLESLTQTTPLDPTVFAFFKVLIRKLVTLSLPLTSMVA